MRILVWGLAAIAVLVATPDAEPHVPVFRGDDRVLDARTSYARYDAIDRSSGPRAYRMRVGAERRLVVELLIPDRAPENRLDANDLPRVVVRGADGRRWALRRIRVPFAERFTHTRYVRIGVQEVVRVPEGLYDLVVTGRIAARFVLVTGYEETLGVADAAKLPLALARVRAWYR